VKLPAAVLLITVCALPSALLPTPPSRGADRFGGTFIGAIIASDGIVIGSDSRSTFVDKAGKRIGYVDRMVKVYVNHGAAVAVSGLTSVEDELFSSFMRRNDFLLARPVDEILFDVALRLPFRNATSVVLISAGYVAGEPVICAKVPSEAQSCRKSGFITNKSSPGLRRWLEQRSGSPSSTEAAAALEMGIREAADVDTGVGGPTTLLLVPKSGAPRWLANPPNDNGWARVCDVVNAYRNGRASIFFTNSKDELDRYLASVCPK